MRWKRWVQFVLWFMAAFLLGRVIVMGSLLPFALPFLAVVRLNHSERFGWLALATLCGTLSTGHDEWAFPILFTEIFIYLFGVFVLKKMTMIDATMIPLVVFGTILSAKSLFLYAMASQFDSYSLFLIAMEAFLGLVFSFVLIHARPLFFQSNKQFVPRLDELICATIVITTIISGFYGSSIAGLPIDQVLARYIVLLFAMVGGAPYGTVVGVITGLITTLPDPQQMIEISLLASAGLFAGLLREGRIWAVVLGFWMGTLLVTVYTQPELLANLVGQSLIASILLFVTPVRFLQKLMQWIPGLQENTFAHIEYAKKIREMTAARIKQFADVFRQLANSFRQIQQSTEVTEQSRARELLELVMQNHCYVCSFREKCWERNFSGTMEVISEMIDRALKSEHPKMEDWEMTCSKSEHVWSALMMQLEMIRKEAVWKKQLQESHIFVSNQLQGVSQVMENLAEDIERDQEVHLQKEDQIRQAMNELGLPFRRLELVSLEAGEVCIELEHSFGSGDEECKKMIAPLFSSILNENVTVQSETVMATDGSVVQVIFHSAKPFLVETGMAGYAKGGGVWSGDSYRMMELGEGRIALALSDGMGNGEKAYDESNTTLNLLQQFMQTGMDERIAVQSVNSLLLLRSKEEMYATIDLAMIDLQKGLATFMKNGSIPSYIRRGKEVIRIQSNNLPVGIVHEIDVDLIRFQLIPGDTLIMMSDGVYDTAGFITDKDRWFKRILSEIDHEDPQFIAERLLERVTRWEKEILDDMTVIVARMGRLQSEWATFRRSTSVRLDRPRIVS